MSVAAKLITAEDLFEMSSRVGRSKLIEGELIHMSPASFEHGSVTMRLSWRIAQFVDEHDLGEVLAAETGFMLHRDPKQKNVTEYRSSTEIRILKGNDRLTAPSLLNDWSVEVEKLFP